MSKILDEILADSWTFQEKQQKKVKKNKMENQLREIISRVAEISADFAGTAHFKDDLAIDSFHRAEIDFEIERVFGISLNHKNYVPVQTMDDILKMIVSIKEDV